MLNKSNSSTPQKKCSYNEHRLIQLEPCLWSHEKRITLLYFLVCKGHFLNPDVCDFSTRAAHILL